MRKNFKLVSLLLSLMLCISTTIFGQETTGEIQGTVKDPQGAVIPNADITIKGIDVGFNRTIQTDQEGYYRARQIPPGLYVVTASAANFQTITKENVQIVLEIATTVDFNLTIGGGQNVVDVLADGGATAIDTTDTKVQENITVQEIDRLPKGTNITSVLRTTTAVRAEPLSGQFQINGGSGAENSFIVDGQEVSNFRTGIINGSNDIPFTAVQELQVKASGFEAEFGGATGGVVNIVTKSGTNGLRGEFGLQFETQRLNAGPRPVLSNFLTGGGTTGQDVEYFRQRRDEGTNFFPTASLGGPIVKDKFWFYGIYSPRVFETIRTTDFVTGFGSTRRIINGAPGSLDLPVTIRNLGADATQRSRAKQTFEYSQIRLDATPTNSLRLSSSFTYNPIVQDGLLVGGGAAGGTGGTLTGSVVRGTPAFADFGGTNGLLVGSTLNDLQGGRQNANNFRIEGNYTPNSKLVTTLRYARGFLNEKLNSYFIPESPRFRCRTVTGNASLGLTTAQIAALAGCVAGFQNTTNNFAIDRDVSIRNTVDADFSYLVSNFGGRHEFKGGYQFNRISNDVSQGYRDQGIVNLCYGILNINTACGGVAPPTLLTPSVNPNIIGIGFIQRFSTEGRASNRNQALYIQDKYQPVNRLTFNLGVRIEQEDLPAFNGQTTNLKFSFRDKIAPRLGASFDLTGDGKTKVSAFYGWFYDRLKFELPRGSFGGDFFRQDFFEITRDAPQFTNYTLGRVLAGYNDPIGGTCPRAAIGNQTRCNVDYRVPSNLPNLVLSDGAPLQPGAVDPNLKPFRQSEFNINFERQIFTNFVARARYIYRNVDNAVEDAGFLTSTNSEFYIIANPGEGLYAQRARELGFDRLATPQRRYDAFQAEVDTRFIRDFTLNVNYTLSRLYGNYSGLANSDENGRLSPGVNRNFDQPFVGFTASGQPDNGRLATDRPHVFKAAGTYAFNYFGNSSNTTDFSFFTTVQSGTPQTTFVDVFNIFIPETRRGDLGRTEKFTQTDLNFTHRYRFGRDERLTLAFDFNVLNVFNEANVLTLSNNRTSAFYVLQFDEVAPTYREAVNILTSRGVLPQLNASIAADPGFNLDQSYRQASLFQDQRRIRFGFRFLF